MSKLPILLNTAQAVQIVKRLAEEFPNPTPPLQHRSAFELLLAVILSAQCTDARVNLTTPLLFPKDRPCTPDDILNLGLEEVKRIIHPCGFYNSKGKALMGTAVRVKEIGGVPDTFEELVKLPGVGGKTAQVILSQWFKQAAFPVDTHVHRVCNRLGLTNSGKNVLKTERQAKAVVPKEYWSDLHLLLIYHGRKTCTAYKPKCRSCPVYELCHWPQKEARAAEEATS